MPTSSTTSSRLAAPRLLFFAGKGGVGKTTCAAARAVAEARRGRRVLVASTDPAHSLGDALAHPLSPRPASIRLETRSRRGVLAAVELSGRRAFARWLRDHRQALGDVLEHGTWLDRDDINSLLDLSLPGVDELMALIEIGRIAADRGRGPQYDVIVVDTAPTGHTLRLLAAPDAVAAVAAVLDDLQETHRLIRARFGRPGRPEAADRLIEMIATQAREAGELLRDAARTAFHLVLLPEALSVAETEDALASLGGAGLRVADLIVNRVTPPGGPCPLCTPRRKAEAQVLRSIRRIAAGKPVRPILARVTEPRGADALGPIGNALAPGTRRSSSAVRRPPFEFRQTLNVGRRAEKGNDERRTQHAERRTSPETIDAFRGARLLLFGGKGGVGKTTSAAAVALRLAVADPTKQILLLSTDPAHSLGDVLDAEVGDEPRRLDGGPSNLAVRELDAARALAGHMHELEAAVAEITSAAGAGMEGARGVSDVMDLAPPGIDELLGIVSVVESLGLEDSSASAWDLVVCDTAPTGHALRLLEMPDAAREWVQTLLRLLLKYRQVVRPGRLAQRLVALSHSIRRLRDLLRDPRESRFIVVTRAAELPRVETERLLARLRTLSLAVPAVVFNAVTLQPRDCPWCRAIAAAERPVIRAVSGAVVRRSKACAIILTPLIAPPPRGVAALVAWADRWVAASRPTRAPAARRTPKAASV